MKSFSEPNAVKSQSPKDVKKSPFDFRCPQYDERSSSFVNAGTHYGSGINQPVGHHGDAKEKAECLPMECRVIRIDRE